MRCDDAVDVRAKRKQCPADKQNPRVVLAEEAAEAEITPPPMTSETQPLRPANSNHAPPATQGMPNIPRTLQPSSLVAGVSTSAGSECGGSSS